MTGHDAKATVDVLVKVYDIGGDERIQAIVAAIIKAALASRSATAGEFAVALHKACVERGGDMDGVLGVAL